MRSATGPTLPASLVKSEYVGALFARPIVLECNETGRELPNPFKKDPKNNLECNVEKPAGRPDLNLLVDAPGP